MDLTDPTRSAPRRTFLIATAISLALMASACAVPTSADDSAESVAQIPSTARDDGAPPESVVVAATVAPPTVDPITTSDTVADTIVVEAVVAEPDAEAAAAAAVPLAPELESMVTPCASYEDEIVWNGNLIPCSMGPRIAEVQRSLITWGVGDGLEADGFFGPSTQRALLVWQQRHGWPTPTTELIKYEPLIGQILASLTNPDLPRNTPCPVWTTIEKDGQLDGFRPDSYQPVFALCDRGEGIENLQSVMGEIGYPTTVDGQFDVEFLETLHRLTREQFGAEVDYVDWNIFWFVLGD